MLLFVTIYRLVYAKQQLWAANLSRAQPSTVNQVCTIPAKSTASCTQNTHFQNTALSSERLVCAKQASTKLSVVSSTRDAIFFYKLPFRLHETLLYLTALSRACPSPARWGRWVTSKNPPRKKNVAPRLHEILLFLTSRIWRWPILGHARIAYAKQLLFLKRYVSCTRNTYLWRAFAATATAATTTIGPQ